VSIKEARSQGEWVVQCGQGGFFRCGLRTTAQKDSGF